MSDLEAKEAVLAYSQNGLEGVGYGLMASAAGYSVANPAIGSVYPEFKVAAETIVPSLGSSYGIYRYLQAQNRQKEQNKTKK